VDSNSGFTLKLDGKDGPLMAEKITKITAQIGQVTTKKYFLKFRGIF